MGALWIREAWCHTTLRSRSVSKQNSTRRSDVRWWLTVIVTVAIIRWRKHGARCELREGIDFNCHLLGGEGPRNKPYTQRLACPIESHEHTSPYTCPRQVIRMGDVIRVGKRRDDAVRATGRLINSGFEFRTPIIPTFRVAQCGNSSLVFRS